MREVKNLFVRTNMLISRFKKCSTRIKTKLFRAYCLCMYDLALWHRYTSTDFNKLKSCYHKCIKKLFGFARMDSMTGILAYANFTCITLKVLFLTVNMFSILNLSWLLIILYGILSVLVLVLILWWPWWWRSIRYWYKYAVWPWFTHIFGAAR